MRALRLLLTALVAAAALAGPAGAQQDNKQIYDSALKSLQSTDPKERAYGLVGLALIGTDGKGASKQVVQSLLDPDEEVRKEATTAIKAINPKLAAPVLELLQGTDYDKRKQAVTELAKMGKDAEAAVPALTAFVGQAKGADKVDVVNTLVKLGAADKQLTVQMTTWALKDPDAALRKAALAALPKLPDPGGQVPTVLKVLEGFPTDQAKVNAAAVLAAIGKGNNDALQALQRLKNDNSQEVRAAAKAALDKVGK